MSDNNELTLLGEDLGDDDYDLGNEDEDALLADDCDLQRDDYLSGETDNIDNSHEFEQYDEPLEDDVLDLGVTDGLDDLESEIQDTNDNSQLPRKLVVIQDQAIKIKSEESLESKQDIKPNVQGTHPEIGNSIDETNPQLESEEEEEGGDGEGRGRFKSERTNIVSLKTGKTYGNIPDSLDNVIPAEGNESNSQKQQHKRDGNQWRNRRGRNGPRGGRQHFHSKQQPSAHFQGSVFSPGPGFVRHPLPPQQMHHHHHLHLQHQHQQPLPMQQLPPPQQGPHPMQQPLSQPQQQQPPHKILINPHFRGAVQPHPEARLIWDTESSGQAGDALLPFPPRVFMDGPYASGPQGNYEHNFQHHESVVFHNSIPPQHQQIPQQQPTNQSYYPGDMYMDHPSQPPIPQPHHPHHQPSPNVDYWHDIQPPHPPNQLQGHPHGRENFYPPPEATFNPPPFSGPGAMPPEQQPFAVHMDSGPSGPPQPAVWQDASPDSMQISASQMTSQQFPSTQGVFRMGNPVSGPGSGPSPRFRPSVSRNFRNFPQQRPRFPGPMNGPHMRRPVGPIHHGLSQPSLPPSDAQPPQQQSLQLPQNFRSPQKRQSFEGPNNTVVPLTQGRFDPTPKRKKRMPVMSNLHEVKTVDTLPQTTEEQEDENEDEETREYRKKIEEQKRLRERILQQKEARRKLAALEKQRELEKKSVDVQAGGDASSFFAVQNDPPQGNAIATIVNRNTIEPHTVTSVQNSSQQLQTINKSTVFQENSLNNPVRVQSTVPVVKQHGIRGRLVRGRGRGVGRGQINNIVPKPVPLQKQQQQPEQFANVQPQNISQQQPQPSHQQVQQQTLQQQQNVEVVPLQGAATIAPSQRIVRTTLRSTASQKSGQAVTTATKRVVLNQSMQQRVVQVTAPRTVVLRGANTNKLAPSQLSPPQTQQPPQRRVVQAQQTRPNNTVSSRMVISGQNVGITITAQPSDAASLPRTKLVAVENLAASTTDSQLRRMCQRVGIVENIQMIPAQRSAVITFSNPSSAVTFLKRYQRKMVDLSLINVKLLTS